MIYILILLPVAIILLIGNAKQKQRENNKPIIDRSYVGDSHKQPVPAHRNAPSVQPALHNSNDEEQSVLIVDDQMAIRILLRELFEQEGLLVYEAVNGTSAIEVASSHQIDFILLDLKMPDMDGIEALQEIRKFNKTVQVAMITAFGDPDKLDKARQLGVQSFFTKPFDIDYLRNYVLISLNNARQNTAE
ncbi:response regulator receiver domain-containing protein [Paenibacillus taihuensis]|uniref:Response regulator receiver domain-containing protein n=1 Tax=Paenibacillus taihuensis TaxID=1156355 RepID=A0A3D9RTP5_9BACL|nr:response regulator [Paenibacillus taihuensis]REE80092.1 response regulator receiver domain-containing protein [Paenibacillus taihuensis]